MICEREGVQVQTEDVFKSLVDISAGDLRRSINMLQTASAFKHKNLGVQDVESISGVIPDEVIKKIDKVLQSSADGFGEVQTLAQDLILEGFDVQQLLYQVLDFYIATPQPDLRKSKISEVIAETDIKLLQGGDEELNLLYALSNIGKILRSI